MAGKKAMVVIAARLGCLMVCCSRKKACVASFEMKPAATLKRWLHQFAMTDQLTAQMSEQLMEWG